MKTLTPAQRQHYDDQGYIILPAVIPADQCAALITHFMAKRAEGPKPHDYPGTELNPKDTNLKYPRMRQMQEWDPVSDDLTQRPQILNAVADLIDDRPKLHQTMIYFKPPGGSGQGLHQDQQYIPIEPLVGVWIPLEPSDQHVGYMTIIPASHKFGLLEVEPADPAISFTTVQTKVPDTAAPEIGLNMNPGDALFFHGKLIHGSYPNTTKDRWRRTFIIHYEGQNAKEFQPPKANTSPPSIPSRSRRPVWRIHTRNARIPIAAGGNPPDSDLSIHTVRRRPLARTLTHPQPAAY